VSRAVDGTSRRPPRRTLGRSPRWISRQIVERDTPSVRPASSTVTISTAIAQSYHNHLIVSIVSQARKDGAAISAVAGSSGSMSGLGSARHSRGINELELVSLTLASWNIIGDFLPRLDTLKRAA
jgi:hypothetical protein